MLPTKAEEQRLHSSAYNMVKAAHNLYLRFIEGNYPEEKELRSAIINLNQCAIHLKKSVEAVEWRGLP